MPFHEGAPQFEREAPMKKWVDIVSFDPVKREGKVRLRCILEPDGKLRFEGDETMVRRVEVGVYSTEHKRRMTPDDGEEFMKALPQEFHSAELFASDVKQGEKIEEYVTPPVEDVKQDIDKEDAAE